MTLLSSFTFAGHEAKNGQLHLNVDLHVLYLVFTSEDKSTIFPIKTIN